MIPKILIVSAPSGTGKTTVVERFLESAPGWRRVVTCTTRSPRPGEEDGKDYRFLSESEFDRILGGGGFVESAFFCGFRYGTPRDDLERIIGTGMGAVLVVDTQGKKAVDAAYPGVLSVFLLPPSSAELERRLRRRGKDSEAAVRNRLAMSVAEMAEADGYGHVLINDGADDTARVMADLCRKEFG